MKKEASWCHKPMSAYLDVQTFQTKVTDKQITSYHEVVDHQHTEPKQVYVSDLMQGCLMVIFDHITIGIERDGYAHS